MAPEVDTLTPSQIILVEIHKQLKAIRADVKRLSGQQEETASAVEEIADALETFLGDSGE